MRDIALVAGTIRAIRDEGSGIARRVATGTRTHQWCAGTSALNGQAVSDLITDG